MTSLIESRNWVSAILAAGVGYSALSPVALPGGQRALATRPCATAHSSSTASSTPTSRCALRRPTSGAPYWRRWSTSLLFAWSAPGAWRSCRHTPIPPGENPCISSLGEVHHPKRPDPAPEPEVAHHPRTGTLHRHRRPGSDRQRQNERLHLPVCRTDPGLPRTGERPPDRRARAGGQRRLLPQGPDHS